MCETNYSIQCNSFFASIIAREKPYEKLAKYIAEKGSITVDGVSLTVNAVSAAQFVLNIVPHTAAETVINDYRQGSKVHLEVDLVARYLERLLTFTQDGGASSGSHSSKINFHRNISPGFTRILKQITQYR